jgi:quercetin dioxygenase-like cupin family protein
VLLDNDRVLMVRNTFPPGKSSGLHTHEYPQRTVYVVQGGRLLLQPADPAQPVRTIEVTTGSALMLPAQSHNIRNVGETTVILIETELKAPEAVVRPPQQ